MKSFEIIGHRGFPDVAPENTLASFKKAIELKADMIECDVTLTKDKEIVVIHDDTINRTTNGRGAVFDFTLQELHNFDAGSWFDRKFNTERIPTLVEVLTMAKGLCRVNIEVKSESVDFNHSLIEEKVIQEIDHLKMTDQVIISSFEWLCLKRIKAMNAKLKTALLFSKAMSKPPSFYIESYQCDAVHLSVRHLSQKNIEVCQENRLPVRVYTVNQVQKAIQLKNWGVCGIFTDKLKTMVEALLLN